MVQVCKLSAKNDLTICSLQMTSDLLIKSRAYTGDDFICFPLFCRPNEEVGLILYLARFSAE